jgi:hypothetical protein
MRRGHWHGELTAEAIKIGSVGGRAVVIDGQHRLAAIVESGAPIRAWVAENVPVEAFRYLDQGKPRDLADILTVKGYADAKSLASAMRMLWKEDRTGSPFVKPDGEDAEGEAEIFAHCESTYNGALAAFHEAVLPQLRAAQRNGMGGVGWILYLAWRMKEQDGDLCEKFLRYISTSSDVTNVAALAEAQSALPKAFTFARSQISELREQYEREGATTSGRARILMGRNRDMCDATVTAWATAWKCAREGVRVPSARAWAGRFEESMTDFPGIV